MKKYIISLIFLVSISGHTYADSGKIILNTGKEIKSGTIWEENGFIKYSSYGATVSLPKEKVYKVIYDESSRQNTEKFQFDIWELGSSVYKIINTAERNNKPLNAGDYPSGRNTFDYRIKKYANSAEKFCYTDEIIGKRATIRMYLSPSSRKLHTIKIAWTDTGNTEFVYEVESVLVGKYGNPELRQGNEYDFQSKWTINGKNHILLEKNNILTSLTYLDTETATMAHDESQIRHYKTRQKAISKDKKKF